MFPYKRRPKEVQFPVEANELQRQREQGWVACHENISIGSIKPYRNWDLAKLSIVNLWKLGGRGGLQNKERMGHTFTQRKGVTEDNTTLVPGKYGKTLNDTCYNCRKPGHLAYNLPEAGRKGTCSLQAVHTFSQKKIQQNEPINDNWVLLDTCSSASVLKMHIWRKMSETATQRRNSWCWQTAGIYLSIIWGSFYYFQWKFTSMNHPWWTSFLLRRSPKLQECTSRWTRLREN